MNVTWRKPIKSKTVYLHPGKYEVTVDGERVGLTLTLFKTLELLMRKAGWVFSREQIISGVRGEDYSVTERAIDTNMVALRRKLGKSNLIESIKGVGYKFVEETKEEEIV